MKLVWVLQQKQKSRGFVRSRGWNKTMPSMTKQIVLAKMSDTKEGAEDIKSKFLAEINTTIEREKARLVDLEVMSKTTYPLPRTFEHAFQGYHRGGWRDLDIFRSTASWNVDLEVKKSKMIVDAQAHQNLTIARYQSEYLFMDKSIFINQVEMGMRFNNKLKQKITFETNDNNRYCVGCGGDIPTAKQLCIGYHTRLCVMCLSEMIPEIQKAVSEMPTELKDSWMQERFLKDLG